MQLRPATAEDSAAACDVLRRSIAGLCIADHGNDPAILAGWLANKTLEAVAGWITAPDNTVLVAVEGSAVLAVGSVTAAGRIGLNYVAPEARFRGISKAMLAALEEAARRAGATQCRLESTATARRFYLAAGYAEDGPPVALLGARAWPMVKALAASP